MDNQSSQLPKFTLENLNKLNKDSINTKPTEGTIVDVKIETWREHLDDVDGFENPDQQMIFVKFDTEGEVREDKFTPTDTPTPVSKLGRFILKYDSAPKVGLPIKVTYNKKGFKVIAIKN